MDNNLSSFQHLPEDVLSEVFSCVGVETLLNLRQTCKRLECITRNKQLWLNILANEFATQHFAWPNYLRPMDSIAANDFEPLVSHLVRLHRVKHNERSSPAFIPLHRARSVTWVQLIRGRWLAVAEADEHASVLSIWELKSVLVVNRASHAILPVYQVSLDGPVVAGLLDSKSGIPILALELRPASRHVVEILEIRQSGNNIACVRLARYEGVSRLRDLHGSLLAFSVHNGLSIPTIMDLKTGNSCHLLPNPEITGGAISMKIKGDVVAVVSPRRLRIFRLNFNGPNGIESKLDRTLPLEHSIGFAALQFYPSTSNPGSTSLYVALSGEDGAYVYAAEENNLTSKAYADTDQLTCVWRHHASSESDTRRYYWIRDDVPFYLLLGEDVPTLSWFNGVRTYTRPINFTTLSGGLPSGQNVSEGLSCIDSSKSFELQHPSLPALYARGVCDYDDRLGVVVLGNAFGELCVFNLANSDLEKLQVCFEPLVLSIVTPTCDVLSIDKAEFSSAPQFIFPAPANVTERQMEDVVSRWRVLQPQELPPGWYREATDPTLDPESLPFASHDTWLDYIATFRCGETDVAWELEHARHFYGDPVPLVRNSWAHIFESGGLLFLWDPESQQVLVAGQSVTLQQVMVGQGVLFSSTDVDAAAKGVGFAYYGMWDRERHECGRNRWRELEERGGIVDPVLLDDERADNI